MQKKQIAALNRILSRETLNRKDKPCGVHPAGDGYVVTDRHVAVLLLEKPEGFPEVDCQDDIAKQIQNDRDYGDHIFALTVTTDIIKEWKRLSKDWRAGKTHKTGAVPVKLTAQKPDGGTVDGFYDPRYLVDAVEAIGPSAMLYIGRYGRNSPFYSLLVYPKNWMEDSAPKVGYVLPLRIM